MNKKTTLIIASVFLIIAFVFLYASWTKPAKTEAAISDATFSLDVTYFANYTPPHSGKPSNMSDNIYVGTAISPFAKTHAVIPLTANGLPIIDIDSTDNVPGLHITRKQGYVEITAYGFNPRYAREEVKANFNFTNATLLKAENNTLHPYEKQGNGTCGIVIGRPKLNKGDDQIRTSVQNSGSLCSTTSIDADTVRIFYSVNANLVPQPECSSNTQCGTDGAVTGLFCKTDGNVYQTNRIFTCTNPGTSNSTCTHTDTDQQKQICSSTQTCQSGTCQNNSTNTNGNTNSNNNNNINGNDNNNINGNNNIIDTNSNNNTTNTNSYIYNNADSNSNNGYIYHSYQRCVSNYLYWYDSNNNQQDSQYCQYGCSNNYCLNYNNNNYNNYNNLSVTETVKNLTTGSNFANSIYASPSDMLMFMITLRAVGQSAQNVTVRDYLPSNLIYNDQLVVSGNNNYSNYYGNISSGINLNTINAEQTVTITYRAQVAGASNFSYGTTTLNNNVSVTSSNANYVPVNNASVLVTRSAVYGASYIATGLTNNFWVDSFFLPLLLTLILFWLWKSGMFIGAEKWLSNKNKMWRKYKAEKELANRITLIRQSEMA
ncbi:MAG: hypothetical protein A2528_03035 [Candidatus Staskawiczbacteria bacterium RIFOXYD2_FULL_37_9]|uniref:DUF11 domain-containing protein n=1 Tax=Candidatus Staskawiczbacteria bacterium RIFOXYB1_FULL_37_44 TaxID=1802223 RepID=A0A1G2IWY2_9BACT|nr:MAG: hypothetical protein A2358_00005 [Candidatus Staskawiczbacteria bacterium RIFOXYB1_FULL_37_44]OGZ90261.1 MAG: hypothetical protein A2581_02535 [Candidatus Staskawiczbacteria bacterium RIFOXYD1_FULL_37_110]OGZ93032.1 MAG: hypothetical protein A2528_03035 [Candidatus Staskawiczbacteria bacterium RIFOXYD2_FULL_37_9]